MAQWLGWWALIWHSRVTAWGVGKEVQTKLLHCFSLHLTFPSCQDRVHSMKWHISNCVIYFAFVCDFLVLFSSALPHEICRPHHHLLSSIGYACLNRSSKIAMLTYRVLEGSAPRYLGPFARFVDQPSRWMLCSASSSSLLVPPVSLSMASSRIFTVAGLHFWNNLPEEMTSALSLAIFCQRLKTWLFRQFYPELIIWSQWRSQNFLTCA